MQSDFQEDRASYSVSRTAGTNFTITAAGTHTIRLAGTVSAAAGNISASTIGNTVTLVCTASGKWVAIHHEGTWTVT
jgi:hypothetical protein